MKRSSLRANGASSATEATPATWLAKPRSRHASMREMPERPARSRADTPSSVLPRQDTRPMPVTTTRRRPPAVCAAWLIRRA